MDHLSHLYGADAAKLSGCVEEFPDALEKIAPGTPDLWAQVYHAVREEWALTPEDVIHHRTTLGLRGFDTPEIRRRISAIVNPESGALAASSGLGDALASSLVHDRGCI